MSNKINILLISFPNAGKTTLFNHLTGKHSKIVNYPGSTVDFECAPMISKNHINIIDVPGITSLNPSSEDEKIAVKSLSDIDSFFSTKKKTPDLVISLIDATQASRHLVLTKQLIDQNYNVIAAVTMLDMLESDFDVVTLGRFLTCPIVSIDGRVGSNVDKLKTLIINQLQFPKTPNLNFDLSNIERLYQWSENAVNTINIPLNQHKSRFDFDRIFLHPVFGGLSFFIIMTGFFYSIFSLASPFMDFIEFVITSLMGVTESFLPEHLLSRLFIEGILGGLAAVLVFAPQIAILFLGIGLMESTGYLARAAVLVDRPLSIFGLSGRAFVPMLSGFACAIPAMLSARTISNQKERLLCIFLIPLMQCSARLPVYGLLIPMLFYKNFLLSSLAMTLIYFLSVCFAGILSSIVAKILKIDESRSNFHIELPQYRLPIWKNIFRQVYQQTKSFIIGAGSIIFYISIALWVLSEFPSPDNSFAMQIGQIIEPIFRPMGLDWRVGVAILLSFAAREVFVSALVVLFGITAEEVALVSVLKDATFLNSNELIFTIPSIIGLILFFMIAMQCAATLAVAKKELKSWKVPLIQLFLYISVAYLLAVIVNCMFV